MPQYASDKAPVMVGQTALGTTPIVPTLSLAQDAPPILTGGNTDAQLYDQSITYNEVGLTYDQIGIAYGGVYGGQEKRVMLSMAPTIQPTIVKAYDQAGTATIPPSSNSGMLIGILGLTYP